MEDILATDAGACPKCRDHGHYGPDGKYCDCPKGERLKAAIRSRWEDD